MDIRSELRAFISTELLGAQSGSAVSDSDDLLQRGLDSMGILRLMVFIEDRIGVAVPDEAVVPENVRTVDALVRLIESLR
jgi:acyl carrier protein